MTPSAEILLTKLALQVIGVDRGRPDHLRALNDERLPHILISIPETADERDILEAAYAAGARDQRDRTREAFNRCADTFRNGQLVASPDDILSLSENTEPRTENREQKP